MNKRRLWHREVDCKICHNVRRNLQKIWWNQNQHLLAVTAEITTSYQPKHQRESTFCLRIFPEIPSCVIRKRTKPTRAACRRNSKTHTPRNQVQSNQMTADESSQGEGESRNNQRERCNCCAAFGDSMDSKLST